MTLTLPVRVTPTYCGVILHLPPILSVTNDYLCIDLDGWDNRMLDVNEVEEEEIENRNQEEDETEEDFVSRERRDVLRLRLRDFASRAANRRNRIVDWAEILMGLEDQFGVSLLACFFEFLKDV
ncbi:hypothetical protein L1887_05805 [Cichorium endivia]|nr:hypothetical protein L1887_05805 [Cichorium endivia]